MELLTGLPVGQRDDSGSFPEGTPNRRVEEILKAQRRSTSEEGGGSETGPGAN